MADKVNSYSQAAAAAKLPKRIKMEALAALGVVTYTAASGDTARLADGRETEGFVVTIRDTAGHEYECFIGAKVLVSQLARLDFPFKARLVKSGQTWNFSD